MEKLFLGIYDFFAKGRRYLAFLIPVVLLGVFYLCSRNIVLNDDIAAFLPYGSGESSRQSQFVYQNLRRQDKVMSIMRLKSKSEDRFSDIDILSQAADEFAWRLEQAQIEGIKDPLVRVDAARMLGLSGTIAENMPYFLDSADYSAMDSIVLAGDFAKILEDDRNALISSNGLIQRVISADPLHFSLRVLQELSALGSESGYKVIGDYLFTPDSTGVMMNFSSAFGGSETKGNKAMLSAVYAIRDSVEAMYPDVKMEFTGSPVIAVMNADRMKKDAATCATIAVVLIVGLLAWYFRRFRPILLICVPVVFGILAGLAFMGVFQSSISSVALAACCVIFGIAVDYSLLYSTRLGFAKDARVALKDIASPMVIGNITTVGAFLSLLVMSASGMRDFGLFAAVSLVGAILFVTLFLPHWVKVKDYSPRDGGWMGKWAGFRPEEHRYVFWILLAVTIVLFFFSRKVTFSGDFTKINYMAEGQQQLLDEFSSHTSTSGTRAVYAVSEGEDLDQALEASEKNSSFISAKLSDGTVLKTRGIGSLLPSRAKQRERLELWDSFVARHGETIVKALDVYGAKAGFSPDAFDWFKQNMEAELVPVPAICFDDVYSMLSPYILKDSSQTIVMNILYAPEDKAEELYAEYDAFKGKADGSFLFDSFSMTDKMIDILQNDFNKVLAICSVLVFVFLWIAFRRLELALAAFLPMVVSWIWITGIMGIFGVSFNIVNIILATFIFGLGDDYTIFMVEGLQYEHTFKKPLLSSYKTGVTLSALTMFVGVGAMVFAKHPALHSLGAVAVIGMLCVVALAFVLPPILFRFLVCKSLKKNREERIFPIRIKDIIVTVYCSIVFAAALLWMKLKVALSPKMSSEKLRQKLSSKMRFFALGMPRVPFSLTVNGVEYSGKEAFKEADRLFETSEPGIVISNHQSHLDLLYLLALSPKITVMTNRWVYKSPVYGALVRRAGFVCTENGIEENMKLFARLKEEGCSVLVFPEGTRSQDCSILKFKSGAFSLAADLGMDILPIVLFGPGEVLPKGEHVLRRGKVMVEVKDRVPLSGLDSYGPRPLKQAQAFRRYYESQYNSLKDKAYSDPSFKAARDKDNNLYKSENEMV
ncbi:MAG: MMPL family transporter [Bacteroidales bacterium]|nr:MMPL family transporter [Bacteroidales bacterium]